MTTFYTAVQCTNKAGDTGCFIRDEHSPTFPGLVELYAWMKANGWQDIPGGIWTCEKVTP